MEYQSDKLHILSVYPMQLGPERRPYGPTRRGGTSIFTMPAAPINGYQLLSVSDCWQLDRNWNVTPDALFDEKWVQVPIYARQIVNDLVGVWTGGQIISQETGGHPGVGVIAGTEPTPLELKWLREVQARFFTSLFYDGQRRAAADDWKNITDLHRIAAKWLGKEAIWTRELDPSQSKECMACGERIRSTASICPKCGTQLAALPEELQGFSRNAHLVGGAPPLPNPLNKMRRGGEMPA